MDTYKSTTLSFFLHSIVMDPLDVLLKSSKDTGLDVEIKRQGPNGCMTAVRTNELAALHTKSKIASTAQLLKNLNNKEKLEWAIETKNEGNHLFNDGNYKAAVEKYVEALTATDFSANGNVHELALPVLCNLCLCCMKLEEWHKCVLFADQALKLDPLCEKALFRKGAGLVKMGNYDDAISVLKSITRDIVSKSIDIIDDMKVEEKSLKLSANDRKNIPYWLKLAYDGKKKDKETLSRQKRNLERVFGGAAPSLSSAMMENERTNSVIQELTPMSLWELVVFFWECIISAVCKVLSFMFGKSKKLE